MADVGKNLTKGCESRKPSAPLWPKQPGLQLSFALETHLSPCPTLLPLSTGPDLSLQGLRPSPIPSFCPQHPFLLPCPLRGLVEISQSLPAWLSARGFCRTHPVSRQGRVCQGKRDLRREVRSPAEGPLPIYRPHS